LQLTNAEIVSSSGVGQNMKSSLGLALRTTMK